MKRKQAPIITSQTAARANKTLTLVPRDEWPKHLQKLDGSPREFWMSRDFAVQIHEDEHATRITVHSTRLRNGHWLDGITWDELMMAKAAVGYEDCWAVELYPPPDQVVNVANIRHLFVLKEPPPFAWLKETLDSEE